MGRQILILQLFCPFFRQSVLYFRHTLVLCQKGQFLSGPKTPFCVFKDELFTSEEELSWADVISAALFVHFYYRAMRGIAISSRLSVCLSVCDVGDLWSHRLEFYENNFTIS